MFVNQFLGALQLDRNRFVALDADRTRAVRIAEQAAVGIAPPLAVGATETGIDGNLVYAAAEALFQIGRIETKSFPAHGADDASLLLAGQANSEPGLALP